MRECRLETRFEFAEGLDVDGMQSKPASYRRGILGKEVDGKRLHSAGLLQRLDPAE